MSFVSKFFVLLGVVVFGIDCYSVSLRESIVLNADGHSELTVYLNSLSQTDVQNELETYRSTSQTLNEDEIVSFKIIADLLFSYEELLALMFSESKSKTRKRSRFRISFSSGEPVDSPYNISSEYLKKRDEFQKKMKGLDLYIDQYILVSPLVIDSKLRNSYRTIVARSNGARMDDIQKMVKDLKSILKANSMYSYLVTSSSVSEKEQLKVNLVDGTRIMIGILNLMGVNLYSDKFFIAWVKSNAEYRGLLNGKQSLDQNKWLRDEAISKTDNLKELLLKLIQRMSKNSSCLSQLWS